MWLLVSLAFFGLGQGSVISPNQSFVLIVGLALAMAFKDLRDRRVNQAVQDAVE